MKHTAGISRREFLLAGAIGAAALSYSPRFFSGLKKGPPNLLFMHCDQLNIHALSAHGSTFVHTPNMDRLIRQGVSFRLSYSGNPLCSPARSIWYTGRASSETGVVQNDWPLLDELPDLGQWFENRGYESFYSGKWHIPNRNVNKSFRVLTPEFGIGQHVDSGTSRAAQGFLMNDRGNTPFFLSLGFVQPHDICYFTWQIAEAFAELPYPELADSLPPLPDNFHFDPVEPKSFLNIFRNRKEMAFLKAWSEQQWRYYIWSYYRHVEMVDAEIGRVLDALEDSGLAKNTLVLFSSDHGEGMGYHKTVLKDFLYDEATSVPFVVSWPGHISEGLMDQTHLVSGLDLAPTLCDFADIDPPPRASGRSLRPLLEGKSIEWREFLVSEAHIRGRMVRTPEYKLIAYKNDPIRQFFDMRNDPGETRNLIGEPKYSDVVSDLTKRLIEWESKLEHASLAGRNPWRRNRRRI
ncbi:MAG: sulfatase family protein [Methylococcales bacterium]